MSNDLPLKIRADIRDLWISPNSPLQESVSLLTSTLGHKIEAQVQWSSLYNALKSVYEEKSKFVPAVAQVTIAFYGRLLSRIENEANSEWTEQLLTEMAKEPGRTWQLNIEAAGGSIRRPRLTLKLDVGAFFVEFPNKDLPMQAEIDAGFDHDLDSLFTPSTLASDGLNDDEWAEVTEVETYTSKTQPTIITAPALIQTAAPPTKPKLPAADTLLRPTELFKTTVPYNLIVDAASSPLTVQGSHQPSLELIASYLKKWAKINAHDSLKRPVLKVELIESPFCFGVIDAIAIEPHMQFNVRDKQPINPTLILAFIEGVLGYKEVYTTGYRWVFKRQDSFK